MVRKSPPTVYDSYKPYLTAEDIRGIKPQVRDGNEMLKNEAKELGDLSSVRNNLWRQGLILDDLLETATGEEAVRLDDTRYFINEAIDQINSLIGE